MIIETKPLHKKKKRLAKQRSIREIQNPMNMELDTESPMDSPCLVIPDFKIYNRYQELERREREKKEKAWEQELESAMSSSDPLSNLGNIDIKKHTSGSKEMNISKYSQQSKKPVNIEYICDNSQLSKISESEVVEVVQNKLQNLDFIDRTPSPIERTSKE
ncbi:hypothetical protein HHI36_007600 [Cryptolaemus montrouzieri]|uniref:Uncharacterized protein n=1 Tax=Cryptolaemus montrouzieri TaxID=559131 RepID=A0ABD2MQF8_9CUCU